MHEHPFSPCTNTQFGFAWPPKQSVHEHPVRSHMGAHLPILSPSAAALRVLAWADPAGSWQLEEAGAEFAVTARQTQLLPWELQ